LTRRWGWGSRWGWVVPGFGGARWGRGGGGDAWGRRLGMQQARSLLPSYRARVRASGYPTRYATASSNTPPRETHSATHHSRNIVRIASISALAVLTGVVLDGRNFPRRRDLASS